MTIEKFAPEHETVGYLNMPNATIEELRTELEVLGFLTRLLAQPADYNLDIEAFAKRYRVSLQEANRCVDRLIELGYIKREPIIDEQGNIIGYNTHVYATPRKGV